MRSGSGKDKKANIINRGQFRNNKKKIKIANGPKKKKKEKKKKKKKKKKKQKKKKTKKEKKQTNKKPRDGIRYLVG